MKNRYTQLQATLCLACCVCVLLAACQTKSANYSSPAGYDFAQPQKFVLPQKLTEISGIVVKQGTTDSLLAIEDETGHLYRLAFGKSEFTRTKFAAGADYEDLAMLPDASVVVMTSQGKLLKIPTSNQRDSVRNYLPALPAGEYETLCAAGQNLYTVCKQCPTKALNIFKLALQPHPAPPSIETIGVVLDGLPEKLQKKLANLGTSAMAQQPITKEWYLISSVKKMVVVLKPDFSFNTAHELDPTLFNQPEGIAFNSTGELFISNEGGSGAGNILRFGYQPK